MYSAINMSSQSYDCRRMVLMNADVAVVATDVATHPTLVQRVPGISDHDIVQIQVDTSAKILFQKPRSISPYRKANWDGMNQALEAYHLIRTCLTVENTPTSEICIHICISTDTSLNAVQLYGMTFILH